jgi:hypothetical protein
MSVISASRRTDIPAFYAQWFMNRIRAGFCHWINPFSDRVYRISLAPEDCVAVVFWTRHPQPLLPHLPELDGRGYKYYFLYTLLGYPRVIDAHAPEAEVAVDTFRRLSNLISPSRVFWRYDPILFGSVTPPEYHLEQFAFLAQRLKGYTQRCIFSFLVPYGKTQRNLARLSAKEGIVFEPPDPEQRRRLLVAMVDIARDNGMQLYTCCEADNLQIEGIRRSSCVDLQILRELTSDPNLFLKSKPTRPLCGCVESVDIGSYDTCLFGCAYCYATNSRRVALKRHAAHDPDDTILSRPDRLRGVDLETLVERREAAPIAQLGL